MYIPKGILSREPKENPLCVLPDIHQIKGHRFSHLTSVSTIYHPKTKIVMSVLFRCDCNKYCKVSIYKIQHREMPEACPACVPKEEFVPRPFTASDYPVLYSRYRMLKSQGILCLRWRESFEQFTKDMGRYIPDGKHLCRHNTKKLHSPTNTFWKWEKTCEPEIARKVMLRGKHDPLKNRALDMKRYTGVR